MVWYRRVLQRCVYPLRPCSVDPRTMSNPIFRLLGYPADFMCALQPPTSLHLFYAYLCCERHCQTGARADRV